MRVMRVALVAAVSEELMLAVMLGDGIMKQGCLHRL